MNETRGQTSSTDLQVSLAGTLPKPGPIGRLFRLAMALLCAWTVYSFLINQEAVVQGSAAALGQLSLMIGIGVYLSSYVVNIGYLVALGKRPMYALCIVYIVASVTGYLITGSPWAKPLGLSVFVTILYVFTHLGVSFLLAAVFATPGCEMRAMAHVHARLSGRQAVEHCCPIGPLQPLDHWEQRQSWYRA